MKNIKVFLKTCFINLFNVLPSYSVRGYDLKTAKTIAFLCCGKKVGDIVVSTILLREIKKLMPAVRITCFAEKEYFPLLTSNPYVDEVLPLPKPCFTEYLKMLRKQKFDIIMDLPWGLSYFRIFAYYLAGAKAVLAHQSKDIYKFITYIPMSNDKHISYFFENVVKAFGAVQVDRSYDLFPTEKDIAAAQNFIATHNPQNKKVLLFNPQGARAGRTFSQSKVYDILKTLLARRGEYKIILISHKRDYPNLPQDIALFKSSDIMQTAALIKQADYLLSVDTGLVHIGDAFNKKMTVLYADDSFSFTDNTNIFASKDPSNIMLKSKGAVEELPTEDIVNAVKAG